VGRKISALLRAKYAVWRNSSAWFQITPLNVTGAAGRPMAPTQPCSAAALPGDAPQYFAPAPSRLHVGTANSNLRPTRNGDLYRGLCFHLSKNTSAGGIPDLGLMRPTALKRHRQLLQQDRHLLGPTCHNRAFSSRDYFKLKALPLSRQNAWQDTQDCQPLFSSASRRALRASFSSRAF